jgi:hypothetical protein
MQDPVRPSAPSAPSAPINESGVERRELAAPRDTTHAHGPACAEPR